MAQIKKDTSLRKAILQAAVTGKLISSVCHSELDSESPETGRQLLDRIIEERNKKLLEETKRNHTDLQISTKSAGKKSDLRSKSQIRGTKKELPPITADEIPFEIPENWCWCRLGDVVTILGDGLHGTPKYDISGEYYFVNGNNLNNGLIEIKPDTKKVNKKEFEKYKKDLNDLTIFISINGTIGNIAFYNNEKIILGKSACYFNVAIKELKKYFFYLFQTDFFFTYALDNATGTTIKNVSLGTMRNFLIPLPPLSVQNAIVAKLEQVLPLVESYENAVLQKEELKGALKDKMKKAVLQEAVQGKLVPQIAGEGNAKDLLAEIKKNRTDLQFSTKSAGKKSAAKKELPPITEEEIPFEIPESWCWCRLGEIVYNNGQKTPDKKFSYIDIGSIDNINQKLNEKENLILPEKAPSRARKIVKKGDIIYSTVRPYLHNMCIIDKDFSEEPIASTGFAVMSCCDAIYNKFLFYYLLSPIFDNYANDTENSKGVAYPAINDDKLYKGLVPLPPLAEQKRIVAAVEELLPLCEKLN